jgi:hypothetical protein
LPLWLKSRRIGAVVESAGLELPTHINAMTVLGLLKELRSAQSLDEGKRAELDETISRIERHYFGGWESTVPDLRQIAEHWVRRA